MYAGGAPPPGLGASQAGASMDVERRRARDPMTFATISRAVIGAVMLATLLIVGMTVAMVAPIVLGPTFEYRVSHAVCADVGQRVWAVKVIRTAPLDVAETVYL